MRWLKFNAVGAMGFVLQLALLAFLFHIARVHYLLATALSVEAAILHNFVWHRRWTWADRRGSSLAAGTALVRFNLATGLVSIGGNLLSAYLLTGLGRMDPVIANVIAIAAGSVANLIVSDRVVFVSRQSSARLSNNSAAEESDQAGRGPGTRGGAGR